MSTITSPLPVFLQDRCTDELNIINQSSPPNNIPRTVPDTHNISESSVSPPNNRRYLNTPEKFWLRCCAAFFALFTAGWADGLTGAILPHIKEDFHLTYMIASLLFITSTIGFALGVITIGHVMRLLGHCRLNPIGFLTHFFSQNVISNEVARANSLNDGMHSTRVTSPTRARFRILVLASILHASFFILMGVARGFSGVLVAYFLAALGKAFLNGTVNAYVAASPKRPLGQMYACNAIGAFVAPFVCQTLLARGIPWAHFYLGSLSLSIINTTLLALSFRPTRKDYLAEDSEGSLLESVRSDAQFSMPTDVSEVKTTEKGTGFTRNPTCPETLGSKEEFSRSSTPSPSVKQIQSTLRYALKLRYVWAFSFFIWIYSGSETSTQGYMATYLLVVRGANPNTAGYVTSGFWAGVAISRFITGIATPYLSFTFRKHALHCTLVIALSMHICIWFINSIFENAFSTGIIGLVYGPIYPSLLVLAVDLIPAPAHMNAMALIAGFANLGSSLFPFLVGAMSNLHGPKVLVYMTVAQTVTLISLWSFFPTKIRS